MSDAAAKKTNAKRRGRPPKSEETKARRKVTLYLTDDQYFELMNTAKTLGQTMSAAVTILLEEWSYRQGRSRAAAEPRQQEQADERIFRRSKQMRLVRQHMEAKRTVARLGAEKRKAEEEAAQAKARFTRQNNKNIKNNLRATEHEVLKADELRKQYDRLQDRVVLLGEDLQRAMKERDSCREMLQEFLQRRKNEGQDRQTPDD